MGGGGKEREREERGGGLNKCTCDLDGDIL